MARILIVDDQPSFLITLDKILSQHSHVIVKATNAFDAIEKLKNEKFDVLITDAVMPGRTGYDLVTNLRKLPAFENFPVIMLTGKRERRDVEKGIGAGVNDYVLKPIDPQTLLTKLENILLKNSIANGVFHSIAVLLPVSLQDTTDIVELSEVGATIRTNMQIAVGTKIHLNDEFYALVGINPLALRITQCVPDKVNKGFFKLKALFVEPRKLDLAALKIFLDAQTDQKAA